MKLIVDIDLDNEAFLSSQDELIGSGWERNMEIATVFRKLADSMLVLGTDDRTVFDSRGNSVGTLRMEEG